MYQFNIDKTLNKTTHLSPQQHAYKWRHTTAEHKVSIFIGRTCEGLMKICQTLQQSIFDFHAQNVISLTEHMSRVVFYGNQRIVVRL